MRDLTVDSRRPLSVRCFPINSSSNQSDGPVLLSFRVEVPDSSHGHAPSRQMKNSSAQSKCPLPGGELWPAKCLSIRLRNPSSSPLADVVLHRARQSFSTLSGAPDQFASTNRPVTVTRM
ncbi:hypothetical protein BV898_05693 [Hypsibius exemplaris]|uniref:Uncharacterized protein n=1 Tax=Hypsibius exemplaris TaxID=2072580 RepID=A0A1W0WYX6_HYPEX|nr:hypothetical protein BV898_05693 [Hypsibius exemplaris]